MFCRYSAYCGSFSISCCMNIFIWRVFSTMPLHFCSWCFCCCSYFLYHLKLKEDQYMAWNEYFVCREICTDVPFLAAQRFLMTNQLMYISSVQFVFPCEEITWTGNITEMTSNGIQNFFLSVEVNAKGWSKCWKGFFCCCFF